MILLFSFSPVARYFWPQASLSIFCVQHERHPVHCVLTMYLKPTYFGYEISKQLHVSWEISLVFWRRGYCWPRGSSKLLKLLICIEIFSLAVSPNQQVPNLWSHRSWAFMNTPQVCSMHNSVWMTLAYKEEHGKCAPREKARYCRKRKFTYCNLNFILTFWQAQ